VIGAVGASGARIVTSRGRAAEEQVPGALGADGDEEERTPRPCRSALTAVGETC
jgi:hypothetical protein